MELNLADKKYVISSIYKPPKQNIIFFLNRDNQEDFVFI